MGGLILLLESYSNTTSSASTGELGLFIPPDGGIGGTPGIEDRVPHSQGTPQGMHASLGGKAEKKKPKTHTPQ